MVYFLHFFFAKPRPIQISPRTVAHVGIPVLLRNIHHRPPNPISPQPPLTPIPRRDRDKRGRFAPGFIASLLDFAWTPVASSRRAGGLSRLLARSWRLAFVRKRRASALSRRLHALFGFRLARFYFRQFNESELQMEVASSCESLSKPGCWRRSSKATLFFPIWMSEGRAATPEWGCGPFFGLVQDFFFMNAQGSSVCG